MADITMCTGGICTVKNTCYRANAPANRHYQSFFTEPPGKDANCEYYYKEETLSDRLSRANKAIPIKRI